ncbi:hypothetical protein GCM10027068_30400 [Prescottella soli]
MTGRRTLVVEIEDLAIEDGAIPQPRVGSVIGLPLRCGDMPDHCRKVPGAETPDVRAKKSDPSTHGVDWVKNFCWQFW